MVKFKEVDGSKYETEDNVELIRVAESENGDCLTLIKLKEEELYQLLVCLVNGSEAYDTYNDKNIANTMFDNIINL